MTLTLITSLALAATSITWFFLYPMGMLSVADIYFMNKRGD